MKASRGDNSRPRGGDNSMPRVRDKSMPRGVIHRGLEAAHTARAENTWRYIVECRAQAHAQPKAILSQVIVTRRRRAKQNQLRGESAAEQVAAGEAADQVTAGEGQRELLHGMQAGGCISTSDDRAAEAGAEQDVFFPQGRLIVVERGNPVYATDGAPWPACSRRNVFREFANVSETSCLSLLGIECDFGSNGEPYVAGALPATL